ncbi:MAG: hypothetical protein V4533_06395 [Pseudomonadota bacterium]|jgi:hypothetical protein
MILADHIAVLVMELSSRRNGRLSYFLDDLPPLLLEEFSIKVPNSLCEIASGRLVQSGGAVKLSSPLTGDMYRVNREGALHWYDEQSEPNENTSFEYDGSWSRARSDFPTFETYRHGGDVWLNKMVEALKKRDLLADEAEQDFADEALIVPASDRIVMIDHNQPQPKEIISDLEKLANLVREDNSTKITNSDDKPRIVAQFYAARDLLRLNRVSTRAVSGLLLPILTYLSVKFADEIIGELAAALISALKAFLGIAF